MTQPPIVRYRKRPVVVDTVQWTGHNADQLRAFTGNRFEALEPEDRADDPEMTAQVLDVLHSTWVGVKTGQHIVRGVKGEFYPIAEDVLAETYEPADAHRLADGTEAGFRAALIADEDAQRNDRRRSLRVLITRVNNGTTLAPDEAQLLARHVAAEICDANTARAVAAGNLRHVQTLMPELEKAEATIDRVRDLATATRDSTSAGRNDWQIGQHDLALTILAALDEPGPATADTPHVYLSTGCLHGDLTLPDGRTGHQYCQSETGKTGTKKPASCKVCGAPCICGCHQPAPATAEAADPSTEPGEHAYTPDPPIRCLTLHTEPATEQCPHCLGAPAIPRDLMPDHIAQHHPHHTTEDRS
ncbi:hypothetical protein [Streptomyces spiralis]